MNHYLLSIYQPDGGTPPANLEQIMRDVDALNDELKAAGAWVFSNGLLPASGATVVRLKQGELLVTDGPYTETKEHLGGIMIIAAPDLDAALQWARKAAQIITLPIEVRLFHGPRH